MTPLSFIAVVELISRKICIKVILQKLLYAGGRAVVADGKANNNNNDFLCANILEDQAQWRDKTKGLSNCVNVEQCVSC